MEDSFLVQPIQGYLLVPSASSGEGHYVHTLCGRTNFKGAVSPNSGKPLLQLLLLDASDPRLELSNAAAPHLPLFYSWTCPISEGVFSYRVVANEIEVINFNSGDPFTDFPYENYPEAFAARSVDLLPLASSQQETINRLNDKDTAFSERLQFADLDRPRHQVGGIPRLLQPTFTAMQCPVCKKEMPLFASIANENGTPQGFADNEFVQVVYHLCRACVTLSCYHMVD
jgi:hypothetical protein